MFIPTSFHGRLQAIAVLVLLQATGSTQNEGAERGLVLNDESAFQGYTLIAPLRSKTTYLLDMQGEIVHTWESEYPPGNSVYLRDDGTLLRACRTASEFFQGGGQGGRLQIHAWDGTVLWDYACSDEQWMSHHDIEPLPNGNVLVIAWERRTREAAIAAGRDPEHIGDVGFWPDKIVEIEPILPDGGRVVWEWSAFDHLVQDFDPSKANYGDVTEHPERIDVNADHRGQPPLSAEERERQEELHRQMRALGYMGEEEEGESEEEPSVHRGNWLHSNGIDYHPEFRLILLSVRTLNEIWTIDHSTSTEQAAGSRGGRWGHGGDLLYRWGNPRTYGRGTEVDQQLFRQHDATFVEGDPPALLHALVFNNGEGRPAGEFSTVDEISLPFDPERGFGEFEGALPPANPLWTYTAADREGFYSAFISGAQRLPSGTTLVCSGVQGRVFEITREGKVVWDYVSPFGNVEVTRPGGAADRPGGATVHGLFRATRIAPDHPGLRSL